MPKVLVTGGAGFIGSHMVEALLNDGAEVLVVDNLSSGRLSNFKTFTNEKLTFEQISINDSNVEEIIIDYQPEFIFHLAAQANVRKSVEDPVFDADENILGTIRLLEIAKKLNIKGVIFSSTGGAIYGEQDFFPADESHRCSPESPYGISKLCSEHYLEYFSKTTGVPVTCFRFGNVYGPRQNPKGEAGVVAIFVEQAIQKAPLTLNGDGEQTRDFIFVKDVVSALMEANKNINKGQLKDFQIFNLGTEIETSINQVIDFLKEVVSEKKISENVEIIKRPQPKGEQRRSLLTAKKFSKIYKWNAQYSIKQGIESAVNYQLSQST